MAMTAVLEAHFSHGDRALTVRCTQLYNEFVVQVFEGERVVGTGTYRLTIETGFDSQSRGFDHRGLHGLMAVAEADIVQGVTGLLPSYSN